VKSTSPPPTVARAYELARSGECRNVAEIKQRLKEERCDAVEAQLMGPTIHRALRALCEAASKSAPEE
jgi:hypothetical protein